YPGDSLSAFAQNALNYIRNRKTNPAVQNPGSAGSGDAGSDTAFKFEWSSSHFLVILAPADNRLFALKSGILDFNRLNYAGEKLSTTMTMLNPENNVLIVKPFESGAAAKTYMNTLRKEKKLFREYEGQDYTMWLISQDNYRKLLIDKDPAGYE